MKLYLLAGEPSGDRLGAALIEGLRTLRPEIEFRGVAGPAMQAEGMVSLFPMEELSVMGIAEVLPRYRELKRRLRQTAEDCLAWGPDALVTIDSPDFSLRLARLVRAGPVSESGHRPRMIHYVAPSVWAWRPGRAGRMAQSIDHVMALLPFEPPYMEAAGMSSDFVGHPVIAEPVASDAECAAFRQAEGLGEAPLILVLPGSRRAEVARLAPVFGEALDAVSDKVPDIRVVVPAAQPVAVDVREAVRGWPGDPVVIDPREARGPDRKRAAFAAADVALAASGTVSLELAASATPMVVAYDMNWLSWALMSRMARIDTVTLVNLVSGTRSVPEFLGPKCRPDAIAGAILRLLCDKGLRDAQAEAMSRTMERLGRGGEAPGLRAARSVLAALERPVAG